MPISTDPSKTALNENEINSPIQRHTVVEWIIIQDPSICCLQATHFRCKDVQNGSKG